MVLDGNDEYVPGRKAGGKGGEDDYKNGGKMSIGAAA